MESEDTTASTDRESGYTFGRRNVRTGVDVQSFSQFEEMDPSVRQRVIARAFTEHERKYCERTSRPAQHYAARWAAKEAFVKCFADDAQVSVSSVSVVRDSGAPRLALTDRGVNAITTSFGGGFEISDLSIDVSLSHDSESELAMATVTVFRANTDSPE